MFYGFSKHLVKYMNFSRGIGTFFAISVIIAFDVVGELRLGRSQGILWQDSTIF